MVIYNVEAVAEALGVTPSSYFVTLISLANGLGRVLAGSPLNDLPHVIENSYRFF